MDSGHYDDRRVVNWMWEMLSNQENAAPYSINLMWINAKRDPSSTYLYKNASKEETINLLLMPAIKWKKANPDAAVNLWYDGQFVTDDAIKNTENLLNELAQQEGINTTPKIRLRNIRDIPIVKQNPDVFSANYPIYFRVDLLKLIICVHAVESDPHLSAIISDLEVGDLRKDNGRMSKDELFNEVAMDILNKFGVLVNQCKNLMGKYPENQFIQVLNKAETIDAIKHMINACLYRAIIALNLKTETQLYAMSNLAASAYHATVADLFAYLAKSKQPSGIQINTKIIGEDKADQWIQYNPLQHGYRPLGSVYSKRDRLFFIWYGDDDQKGGEARFRLTNLPDKWPDDFDYTRNDIDTRNGNDHYYEFEAKDIVQKPSDGSDKFKCVFYPMSKSLVQEKTDAPTAPQTTLLSDLFSSLNSTTVEKANDHTSSNAGKKPKSGL